MFATMELVLENWGVEGSFCINYNKMSVDSFDDSTIRIGKQIQQKHKIRSNFSKPFWPFGNTLPLRFSRKFCQHKNVRLKGSL